MPNPEDPCYRARMRLLRRIALPLVLLACACGDDDPEACEAGHSHEESPTNSTCDGSTLTYENFGRDFMETYCTRCHSSELSSEEDRQCAPAGHDFDTLDGILLVREHIDAQAAAGPDAVNVAMPPTGIRPTEDERRDLGTWLACEAERMP